MRTLSGAAAPAAEAAILERLRRTGGVRACVALRHSVEQVAPGLVGIRNPVISIPENLASELEPAEFESVLMHELAHVRRHDNFWSGLVHVVACLFWFHPLVWWMERRIAAESERACDDLVMQWGAPPDRYAAAILKVCRLQITVPVAGLSGIGSGLAGNTALTLTSVSQASG